MLCVDMLLYNLMTYERTHDTVIIIEIYEIRNAPDTFTTKHCREKHVKFEKLIFSMARLVGMTSDWHISLLFKDIPILIVEGNLAETQNIRISIRNDNAAEIEKEKIDWKTIKFQTERVFGILKKVKKLYSSCVEEKV